MATLLHGNGVRLLGEDLADFGEVAVLCNFVLYLRGVVNEGELGILAVYYLLGHYYFISFTINKWS